ncbi:MAG: hypothetical protein DME49_04575 [Verrucomicrobia bacterium]|nr:MAG: hypothetical protein DME49_04575 [Verrucomicrobiota bacterium]
MKGGNSRWPKNAKKPRRKNQQKERGINASCLTTPNAFGVTILTLTREENLFSSRFFLRRLNSYNVDKGRNGLWIAVLVSVVHFVAFVRDNIS